MIGLRLIIFATFMLSIVGSREQTSFNSKELGHSDRKTTERYLEKVLQREQEIGLIWKEQDF